MYVVITKVDMCPENILKETLQSIKKLLKSPGSRKIPVGMQCGSTNERILTKFSDKK